MTIASTKKKAQVNTQQNRVSIPANKSNNSRRNRRRDVLNKKKKRDSLRKPHALSANNIYSSTYTSTLGPIQRMLVEYKLY